MTGKRDWIGRVGQVWASEWMRTDRSFGGLTDQLISKASAHSVMRILDVGCGAGELSMAMARGHSTAQVIGIDVCEELIEIADNRAGHLPNVEFVHGDAAQWLGGEFKPDLIISRHGVMFFDDPVAAFRNLKRQAAPDARLVFSCFRSQAENAWAERLEGFLPPDLSIAADRFSPGPFAFAENDHVNGVLRDAGWQDIAFEAVDYAYVAGAGDDPIGDAVDFFQRIGPAARAAQSLEGQDRINFLGRLARYLRNYSEGGVVALRAGAWLVSARCGDS